MVARRGFDCTEIEVADTAVSVYRSRGSDIEVANTEVSIS